MKYARNKHELKTNIDLIDDFKLNSTASMTSRFYYVDKENNLISNTMSIFLV